MTAGILTGSALPLNEVVSVIKSLAGWHAIAQQGVIGLVNVTTPAAG